VERILTVFWLLLIPTQLGRHFWGEWSTVLGVRVDYLSLILYATDIVWGLWVIKQFRITNFKLRIRKLFSFKNLILMLFILVNVILAQAKVVAIYRWLRLGQWWLTWILVKNNKKEIGKYLTWIIPFWIILESFLGLAQVLNAGSLNGIWWWLGERRFSMGGIGIASWRFLDEGWIRAYGTFSHPNSLAGFLLLAWWGWKKLNPPPTPSLDKEGKKKYLINIFRWVVNWSAILGIILAGSRTVWGVTIALLIIDQLRIKNYEWKMLVGKGLLVVGVILLALGLVNINYRIGDFIGGWDSSGWEKREWLGLSALKMIRSNPLFGVGAGNFVVNLPDFKVGNFYWFQPVHNIFLLAWAEIGIMGIIILITNYELLITNLIRKKWWWFLIIVGITGMVDHYWLTLPQNTWLLAIILGLI